MSPEALDAALARLAEAAGAGDDVLVALDFDGVLAPLVDVPSQSRPTPRGAAAMARLVHAPRVHLALVSGRGLGDLAAVAEPPDGTILVGSHGAERGTWHRRLEREPHVLDDARAATLDELAAGLRDLAAGTTARVEVKPTTAVLHTRGVDPATADRLAGLARGLGDRPDVDVMTGRDIVELSVLTVTKGDALRALRDALEVRHVLFAGDDVTDERALATLAPGDVGIRVGDGESIAEHRVADTDAMAETLHRFADLLDAAAA
ncbi:trehalose-phosphatase [Actinotalea sp. M2MS4P-6]|uniref:trehalose-phosphatase n=1 Tax=Actinotalea sp. M2MS4P-6 TaxID=2983762 RepID=UPI0021E51392|nr:trehalose-phosphatase [Actinotalea sp. M2MS4P-6]MCV2395059.1 trehalose-phosphatase [Actinotalea sp. M2MS4P-6]